MQFAAPIANMQGVACPCCTPPVQTVTGLSLQAQQETQKAALSYERAVSMHTAAREMVYVAEQGLMADGKNTLDPTWQEMLNHATAKVPEAGLQSGAGPFQTLSVVLEIKLNSSGHIQILAACHRLAVELTELGLIQLLLSVCLR